MLQKNRTDHIKLSTTDICLFEKPMIEIGMLLRNNERLRLNQTYNNRQK